MAVNEAFIDSATVRENVVSLARNIGYVPRSKRSARANISFSVNTTGFNSKTVTLKAGIVALGAVESGNYIFSIPQDKTAVVDNNNIATFTDIPIYEGSYLTKSYVLDNSQTNQRFIIPNANVDISSVKVYVTDTKTEEYKLYSNIFEVESTSRIFLIQEIEDEKYEVIFGDNILGKRPSNGSSIVISYIVTNGKEANGSSSFTFSGVLIDNNQNKLTTGISDLSTTQSAENGDDIESVDSIKYLGPRVYSSQYRAVTANDYKGLIPYIFPNVESVTAYGGDELDPPEYGKVFISIKPRNGSYISQITKESIKKDLKQYSIAGIKPEIVDLKYLYVEMDVNVYYNKSFVSRPLDIQSAVINTLKEYSTSTDLNSFGGRFKYSKVISLIDNVNSAITSNITKIKIRRNLQPALNRLATYELCFGNQFHLKRNKNGDMTGYNIKSTGFNIKDVEGTVYLSDIPIDDEKGSIFFFRIKNNLPVMVSKNVGTIDYKKGEIRLNPVIFTGVSSTEGIEVQAIPESNDVIALRDIYLELNMANTVVNIIEDTIVSGENLSGSDYAVTSSYVNGEYTR